MTENGAGRGNAEQLRALGSYFTLVRGYDATPLFAAADEIERLRAALVRYGDALDELASPCEGVDTIHTMAERARQTINPELRPPVKPSVIP